MEHVLAFWWVVPIMLALIGYKVILRLFGVVMIPQDSLGIVNKRFVLFGAYKALPDGKIIALNGEAGIQADTLAPGMHWGYWPWQYIISIERFVVIPDGCVGIISAADGIPLPSGRIFGKKVECSSFQDARAFLQNGGERGSQIPVLPPGTFRINTKIFKIQLRDAVEIGRGKVGIVTTKEGKPLPTGEIAGKEIPGHNMFQDGQAFLDGGGFKGLQEQVMLAGRYFLNTDFVSIEEADMTEVPIAHAGVVIAYVGDEGQDVTGDTFKHGNLVKKGQKGVCVEPLDPGKYPINPRTHKVECVPTANVVLNWATGKSEAHRLDERLSTITVRSSDGFRYNLDVSQIIHIPRTDAPKVIARFGTVANLVTQVLEPTIGNYFRNAAQGADVISFLKEREERQGEARAAIAKALEDYNIVAVDTLIGDIVPPEELMKTLTDRKIAQEQKTTYETERDAQEQRQKLEQSKALADTQSKVVDAERTVAIAEFQANAAVKKAEGEGNALKAKAAGEAEAKKTQADADAHVLVAVGEAKGRSVLAVGEAEAQVIQKKTDAIGPQNYAVIEVGRALAENKVQLVPQIMVGGGTGQGNGGTIADVLLANMLQRQMSAAPEPPKA